MGRHIVKGAVDDRKWELWPGVRPCWRVLMRSKQLPKAANARVLCLCVCVRYWSYHAAGTCASVLTLVLSPTSYVRSGSNRKLEVLVLRRGENRSAGEKPLGARMRNNKKPTNGVDTEIWNRATFVEGDRSDNFAILTPPHWPITSRTNKVQTYSVWTAFASLSSTWPLNCLVVTYTVVSSTEITICTHFLRGSRLFITKACPTSAVYCTCIWRTPVIHFKTNE